MSVRRLANARLAFLTVYTLICALTIIFSCIPVSASWNVEQHATAKCYSIQTYTGLGIANSGMNAVGSHRNALLMVISFHNAHRHNFGSPAYPGGDEAPD